MYDYDGVTTTRTLRNIKRSLKRQLEKKGHSKEAIDTILKIHGLHKNNFDAINVMDNFISEKLNDISIDDNSNKNEKTIAGMHNEVTKSIDKAIGYDYLYRQMVKDYGKQEAKRLAGLMYDYSLMLSDSSKILLPYCWAFDASNIVHEGRPFGQLHSKPPQSISSYIAALNETLHQMGSHLAGAIAVGTIFIDLAYILSYRENISKESIEQDGIKQKYVENSLQSFVHSVNHLSRNSTESIFTNVSVFDRPKLKNILEDFNWMFEESPEWFEGDKEGWKAYIIDYVDYIQKIFVEFFDKGDPTKNGMPYRFPVCTTNITKDENNNIIDKDFVDYISNKDIYRYNIFVSSGTKTASCCRLINDNELMELGGQSNSFGGSSISLGSHRVVTINYNRLVLESDTYEEFQENYRQRILDTVKILKAHKNLIKSLVDADLHHFISIGWIRMERLFSTLGILGIYEANLTAKEKFGDVSKDYIKDWLIELNTYSAELAKEYKIITNIEQIPGESGAVRLCVVDKLLYGKEAVPYELYSNQFIPLWEDANIYERMDIDGKYNKLITGGGIVHFGLGEKTTKSQNVKLIKHAVKSGSEHFAVNAVYCICENEHVTFGANDICPICSGEITERLSRVVGFLTPVSSWNKTRREWEFPKRKFKKIE